MQPDTSLEIDALQFERLRAMAPWERLVLSGELTELLQTLARADVLRIHPDFSELDIRRELTRRWYGEELAQEAYGNP